MAPVEFRDLSKRFAGVAAVEDLSFDIEAGRVTGFLGPNGAGKSTTLRALLGLVRPSSGSATFDGLRYEQLEQPAARVGAVLEDASFHPGRTARNHLRILAATGGHPGGRVDEVLAAVDLGAAAGGRAVLVSSHVLAEVAQSVDEVVVIADGQLRAQGTLEQVLGGDDGPATEVRAQDPARLSEALERRGHRVERQGVVLHVLGASPAEVGEIAGDERVAVLGLAPRVRSLEEAFLTLTGARA